MAVSAAKSVWANSRAKNGPLLVLMAIAFEIDDKGDCVMSIAELAARSRLSKRAIPDAVSDLVRLGEIRVRPKSGDRGRNGYGLRVRSCADSAHPDGSAVQNLHTGEASCADSAQPRCAESAQDKPDIPDVVADQDASYAEFAQHQTSDESSTTGLPVVGKPSSAKPPKQEAPRPDVDRLCEHLASRIEANGCKRPNITRRWKDAARRMIDIDGRTEEQVMRAIDWCQKDEFWSANILSMPKLREKYDQLRMKATQQQRRQSQAGRPNPDDDYEAALERIRARKENANGHGRDSDNRPAGQVSLPPAAD